MSHGKRVLKLISILLSMCAFSLDAHAGGLTKIRILMNWFAQADQAGYWQTQLNGPAKNGGLDIEVMQGGPRIQTIPQVAAGQAEFGMANADDLMLARLQGAPVKAVYVALDYVPYDLVYHPNAGIKSITDLKNKTVAVNIGAAYWEWIKKQYHLQGVHEIPVSGDLSLFRTNPNMVQQGYSIFLPYRMTDAGIPNKQFKVAALGYRPYDVLFTTDEMIDKHPDVVRKVVADVKQGWTDFARNPAQTRSMILKLNTLVSPDVHDKAVAEIISDLLPHDLSKLGCMVPARWNETAAQLRDVNLLPGSFDPSQVYDATLTPGC